MLVLGDTFRTPHDGVWELSAFLRPFNKDALVLLTLLAEDLSSPSFEEVGEIRIMRTKELFMALNHGYLIPDRVI